MERPRALHEGLWPECSISNRSGDYSSGSTYTSLLHVCHGSYRPTINGRLLAAGLRRFQVRPVHKWHSQMLAPIRLMISVSSSVYSCVACIVSACSGSPPQCSTFCSIQPAQHIQMATITPCRQSLFEGLCQKGLS